MKKTSTKEHDSSTRILNEYFPRASKKMVKETQRADSTGRQLATEIIEAFRKHLSSS